MRSQTMSQIYRIEVPWRDRFGSSGRWPRFVVIIEIPDHIISALENPGSAELQQKALGIAMNATWNQRVKYRNFQYSSWSSSVVVDVDLADYGTPSLERGTARAWMLDQFARARIRL